MRRRPQQHGKMKTDVRLRIFVALCERSNRLVPAKQNFVDRVCRCDEDRSFFRREAKKLGFVEEVDERNRRLQTVNTLFDTKVRKSSTR